MHKIRSLLRAGKINIAHTTSQLIFEQELRNINKTRATRTEAVSSLVLSNSNLHILEKVQFEIVEMAKKQN